jgi:2-phospho-L-lactate guanylyltransferase
VTTENSEVPHLVGCVVLIPVKAFAEGKARLAPTLDREARAELSRMMATRVLEAAAPLPVAVVCDDAEVARWALEHGAMALPEPGRGLNGAVEAGVGRLAVLGATEVLVAHADLPMAHGLAQLAGFDGVTLVPDRSDDGTNVVCVPANAGFRFAYGPGSFARHQDEATRLGLEQRVVREPDLAWDVDVPADIPAEFVPPVRL